jgi:uncharacterized protein
MDFFSSIFLNEHKEWRAGWKFAFFILIIVITTFAFTFAFKLLPKTLQQIPFVFMFSLPLSSWLAVRFIDRKSLKYIGLLTGNGFKSVLSDSFWGIFGGALAMGIIAFLIKLFGGNFEFNTAINYKEALVFFLLMIAVGIYEELQIRGYMLRIFSNGLRFGSMTVQQGFWAAVAFTSVVFGLLHLGNPNADLVSTLNISIAGLLLVWPIAVTGRMYGAFALHFSWNWFQGGVFGFPVSGQAVSHSFFIYTMPENADIFSGGSFGPEAGIVGIIGMIIASLPFWFIYMRQNRTLRIFETQFEQIKD